MKDGQEVEYSPIQMPYSLLGEISITYKLPCLKEKSPR